MLDGNQFLVIMHSRTAVKIMLFPFPTKLDSGYKYEIYSLIIHLSDSINTVAK